MSKINVLPKSVAELIAAGEVVERPSSVVKELIENSIDAGATNIGVEIKNGGTKYIRITDNGCGISREDVRTAFISHATSKISSADDLNSIFTLGFRGEALPSIAAVSRVSLLTKTEEEQIGTSFQTDGGEEQLLEDAGCPSGTTVIVRDLFYNTPARMKFLKRDMTEGGYVADVITKVALSHPAIKFSLIKDGKQVLATPGNGDLLATVFSLFGKDIAESLIECSYEHEGISVKGFISRPLNNRPNRNMQFFFVNGRFVRIPAAVPALDEAYKNKIMVGKFPMCFLFADISPEKIDVNVHPAKTEIRFSDERKIFEVFYYAARSALSKGDTLRPDVKLKSEKDIFRKPHPEVQQLEIKNAVSSETVNKNELSKIEEKTVQQTNSLAQTPSFEKKPSVSAVMSGLASLPPTETKKAHTVLRDTSSIFANINIVHDDDKSEEIEKHKAEERPFSQISKEIETDNNKNIPAEKLSFVEEFSVQNEKENEIKKSSDDINFRIVGEIFKTYILAECGTKLLIIDKHAAHERIIFNELKKSSGAVNSQLLLAPVRVTLSGREHSVVTDNLDIFEKAGYLIEDFGGSSVIVRECPVELSKEDISALVAEMAGELLKGNMKPVPEKLDWLYHSTACRAAVKAGDKTDILEMNSFVKKILTDDDIKYCPHGRPVMYELSKHEIEKQFGRLG